MEYAVCHFVSRSLTHSTVDVYGNKLNENGKLQVRCLVASTTRLYNMKISTPGMELERKAQWAFPIASLVALVTYGDNPLVRISSSFDSRFYPEYLFASRTLTLVRCSLSASPRRPPSWAVRSPCASWSPTSLAT